MQMTRRTMLAAATGALTVAGDRRASADSQPSLRYPDPAIRILDPSFAKYRLNLGGIERLATGMRWSEGPVWFGDGRYVLWSDIPNDRIMRWDEATGRAGVFRNPSNNSNGLTRDRQGRLVTCEHLTRRVTRTEYDGAVTVLMDRFDGKRLNSPNDIVVKSDDSVWFSDPTFGIASNFIGEIQTAELPTNLYRIDRSGRATVVADDIKQPNGLAFSPDESKLYIVESGANPQLFRVYDVIEGGTKLANGRVFIPGVAGNGPDGFRVDVDGNLWCGWSGGEGIDGVRIFNSSGQAIGHIDLPERCANICFGGLKRNRLFMAASHSLYSLFVGTQGVRGG